MVLSLLAFVNCALEISTLVDMMEWRESMIIILHNIVWPFAIILTYWFKLLLYIFLSGWAITFLLHWEINIWCPPMHWNVMATDIWIACIILQYFLTWTICGQTICCSHTSDKHYCQTPVRWQCTLCGSRGSKNARHGQPTEQEATCKGLFSKKHSSCIPWQQISAWTMQEAIHHWRWESYSTLLFQTLH